MKTLCEIWGSVSTFLTFLFFNYGSENFFFAKSCKYIAEVYAMAKVFAVFEAKKPKETKITSYCDRSSRIIG
jgi:hypothetical protein